MTPVTNSLVSVIITTYNRCDFLEETLVSIENQTYREIEIIVIDDGSKIEISKKNESICSQFSKCKYYYKKNSGQPDSRNFGIKNSNGEFVSFCDDDDFWVLDKLEKQIEIFSNFPEFSIVTGCIEYINSDGEITGIKKCHYGFSHGHVFENYLIKNRTASIIPLLKRKIFDKVGLFNPSFTIAEDWEFWRRVSYYYKFYALNEVLAYVRNHSSNMSKSRNNTPMERFLLYRKLTKSLLLWGKDKFNKEEFNLISKIEWQHYRNLLINHYTSNLKKITFIKSIAQNNFKDAFHFVYLYLKFELFK